MYRLTLSEDQAGVIREALELYSRVGMGQLKEIVQHAPVRSLAAHALLRETIESVTPEAIGLPRGTYYGIAQAAEHFRAAFDLLQVIRHRLAWDLNPQGGVYVDYDEPHQVCSWPLATMEKQD